MHQEIHRQKEYYPTPAGSILLTLITYLQLNLGASSPVVLADYLVTTGLRYIKKTFSRFGVAV